MSATDAVPSPKKNVAYRHYFEFRKNDGTIITTVTGPDTEVSKDGAAFADATNEFTEIGTSGPGYVDLTASEMNADSVVVKATCTNTDAVPYTAYLYPEEAGDIRVNVTAWDGNVLASLVGALPLFGVIESGTAQAATANTLQMRSAASHGDNTLVGATVLAYGSAQGYWQSNVVASNVGSTDTLTFSANWGVTPSGTVTYIVFPTAPGPAAATIAAAVIDQAMAGHTTAGTIGERLSRIPNAAAGAAGGLPTVDSANRVAGVAGNVAGSVGSIASGGIVAASFAVDSITAAAVAVDAVNEIQGGLATAATLSAVSALLTTVAGYLDTEIAAIKAKTDQLQFTSGNLVDANVQAVKNVALQLNGTGTQNIGGP